MQRRFPLAVWITLSLALVGVSASFRFNGTYLVSDQFLLGLLFFVAAFMLTVALICWLPLLRRLPDDHSPGRVVLLFVAAPALAMLLLVCMAFETPAAAEARHRAHLMKVARIIANDYAERGRMPIFFDDALQRAPEKPSHRGDANGRDLSYRKLDPHNALICAPDCRVHLMIRGTEIDYLPWPDHHPAPCGNTATASNYWASSDTAPPISRTDAPR